MSSVSVGVRIPSNLYEKLMVHANKVQVSKSEVIISALAHYLESTKDIPLSERLADLEAKVEELQVLVKK